MKKISEITLEYKGYVIRRSIIGNPEIRFGVLRGYRVVGNNVDWFKTLEDVKKFIRGKVTQ